MIFPFRKSDHVWNMDLEDLKYIVYVADGDACDYETDYVLFVFNDRAREGRIFLRYYLDSEHNRDDVAFLAADYLEIASHLGGDISVKRSWHTDFYSEIIYPSEYKGEKFYLVKDVPSLKISWNNLFNASTLKHICKEMVSMNFFEKRTDYEIDPRLPFH